MHYEYRVIEHYDDDNGPPEPFGFVALAVHPNPGDVVKLKWLDGRDAYDVRVLYLKGNHTMHVKAVS